MAFLHPMALRILAAASASSAAVTLVAGGGAVTTLGSCCGEAPVDIGSHAATLGDTCSVTVNGGESLVERCEVMNVAVCPPFEQAPLQQSFEPVCGPLRPGEPVPGGAASSSSSSAASTGGGMGGGGAGGTGGAGGGMGGAGGGMGGAGGGMGGAGGGMGGGGGSGGGMGGTGGAGGAGGAGTGGGGGSGGASVDAGAPPGSTQLLCCYGVKQPSGGEGCGRPLVVEGRAVTSPAVSRDDWASRLDSAPREATSLEPPPRARAELALRWARDAALEHASIASFARFVLDLLASGAPADLVRAAEAAMRDEIDHAERCYAMASRHAGRAVGPGPLPLRGVTAGGALLDIALRALREGCVGETVAAITATRALEVARDPEARAVLAAIARDEAAHAELAFRFVAWAARDERVRAGLLLALPSAIDEALRATYPVATPDDALLEAHGQPGGPLRRRAAREAASQVIEPCLTALLATTGRAPVG